MYELFSRNEKKINTRMSWSHSCLRWNTRMAPVSSRSPKLTKWVLPADDFFVAGVSLNDLAEQDRLPSLCYVSSHFLFDASVFLLWYFIVPLRDTRSTILTSKELRHKLLTFTIFIIQSQVGAIPVFSRLLVTLWPPSLILMTAKG